MYKLWEYNQFLDFVKDKEIGRALVYAKALGIDRRTLRKWCTQPELAHALTESLDTLLSNMQNAGKNDWRMYEALYKMIGLDDVKNIDLTSGGEEVTIALVEFVGKEASDNATKDPDTIS
jgi:hypothetical protein